tara:strand:+ start:1260 stop:1514 length:255 start_codon:yes stop_codon:yes gene_type:complete
MGVAIDTAFALLKEEPPSKPCKDCGELALKIRLPIWELNGLCFSCLVRRMQELGMTGDESMLDMINSKISGEGQAGDQQRRDLQ